jgi:hypothetical protein
LLGGICIIVGAGLQIPRSGMSLFKYYDKREKRTLLFAVAAFFLFISLYVISYYRQPLLGLSPGVASYNFAFNILFAFPLYILIFILCIIVVNRNAMYWNVWKSKKNKIFSLGLTIPILLIIVMMLGRC